VYIKKINRSLPQSTQAYIAMFFFLKISIVSELHQCVCCKLARVFGRILRRGRQGPAHKFF